ncbi:MAG TPA: TetR/AcrR family transcriptional regulator [Baekduia sp.]|nr:TetR/AcrR family transcriptional regulator [Baekduia sp.]
MLTLGDTLRAVTTADGAAPHPASWPVGARSRLLAAMAGAATARGFVQTSVDDVLAGARASRRTFYVHFENREDCLAAAHDAVRRDALHALRSAEPDLDASLDRLLRYFAAWPAHAHLAITEIIALGPPGVARLERLAGDVAAHLGRCIADPPARAEDALTADDLAQVRVAALFRLVQHRVNSGRAASLPALAPVLARAIRPAITV